MSALFFKTFPAPPRCKQRDILNVLEQIGAKKLGFDAINFLDGPATKALAIFGYMRTTGMLFATIATGMLVKFGGYAVSSLAQGITGNIERAAVSAAERTMNPVTQMQTARGALETSALLWNGLQTAHDPRGWMRELAAAGAASSTISTMTTNTTVRHYGIGRLVDTNVMNTGLNVGRMEGIKPKMKAFGFSDPAEYGRWVETGMVINEDMAKRLQDQGFYVDPGMKINDVAMDNFGNIKYLNTSIGQKSLRVGRLDINGVEGSGRLQTEGNKFDLEMVTDRKGVETLAQQLSKSGIESEQRVAQNLLAALNANPNQKRFKITASGNMENGRFVFSTGRAESGFEVVSKSRGDVDSAVIPVKTDKGSVVPLEFDNLQWKDDLAEGKAVVNKDNIDTLIKLAEENGNLKAKEGLKALKPKIERGGTAYMDVKLAMNDDGTYRIASLGTVSGWGVERFDTSRNTKEVTDVNRRVKDHMNIERRGGTEVTIVTPDGVKTGYLVYDPKLKQTVFVAGSYRYGIDQHMVRYQPEQRSPDGKVISPAGYVLEDVTVDPRTGKVVTGRNTSIFVTEGTVNFNGRDFKATIFTDTKTGKQLAIEGKTGRYWTRTYNQDSWTVHRDMAVHGEVFASVVTKHFGDEAGQYVSDFFTGVGEFGGLLGNLGMKKTGKLRKLQGSKSPHTKPKGVRDQSSSPSIILDQWGRPYRR